MGSLSIQKGKRAEREVASFLNPILDTVVARVGCAPVTLKRNLIQTRSGGYDLEGLDWLAIEIKHQKQVSLSSWWGQTLRQAGRASNGAPLVGKAKEPVLIWKQHGGKWQVRMLGRLRVSDGELIVVPVDVSLASFLLWFEKRAEAELRQLS